ncbi:hypothetical protein J6590_081517 [Homalodisca vitripennis]|nr:hypothetical protein J6590_081517 [Homalodisca vitripennis]
MVSTLLLNNRFDPLSDPENYYGDYKTKSRPSRSLLPGIATSFSRGQNDVATRSQHIIFKHMETILENCSKHSKVLISPLLPRHDLPSSSPIHDTVALVNNFIQELCDQQEGTSMIDISDIHRHHFTPHGLHLTDSGKRRLSCQIVKVLMSIPLRPTQSRRHVAVTRSSEDTTMPPASNPAIPVHPKTLPHESYADAVKDSGKQRISPVQLTNSTNTENKPVC